ncbi:MAG: NAD(P)/FAD-dependent oxidoreductase [Hyphomicrobiales bacterium]
MSNIIVIGAGHNGLVCAWYLARAGHKVTVLEKRGVVGGAAVTEEFHPGFRNSVASYTVSLLNPKVIADMNLAGHGLTVVEREISNFLPLSDKDYLKVGGGKTKAEVAKFSARDAERLDAYGDHLDVVADLLRDLVLQTPPNSVSGRGLLSVLPELFKAGKLGRRLARLPVEMQQQVLNLFTQSAGDYLDQWFESAPIKAAYGFDGIVGNFASPYTPGSAYVLLHHVFGEVNGKKGAWGHAIGGMGAITQAMARACKEAGVDIRTSTGVKRVLTDKLGVTGVETDKGEVLKAGTVVSNLNPKLLFTRMIEQGVLPAPFAQRMENWKCGSGTFRMNVALSELPSFTCLPGKARAEHHTAGIIIAPSLHYMEEAYMDARRRGWSKAPIVEVLIPSTLDDTLAPKGQHVASLFCQHVSPTLPEGRSWDDHREEVADLMIKTVDKFAPGFKKSVIARQINSPLDLERTFGLVGGDIFHGALGLDQLFSARPMLGYADYRTPLKGLYQCGSGTHPGGGVTGAPGHNAAREMLRDLR